MNLLKSLLLSCSLFVLAAQSSYAQEKPAYWNDIQTIKAYDGIYTPPHNPILFIGSSSIRLWVDFEKAFPGYTVLNRAIGGAVTNDVDRYLQDIVYPYQPKQIVIYVGENDLIKAPDGETVLNDFKRLFTDLRSKLPLTPIVYISIKASPSRAQYLDKAKKANQLIELFLKTDKNATYVDVYKPMLDKDGHMRPELFKEDMLHMNAKGYEIWNKLLKPHLLKD